MEERTRRGKQRNMNRELMGTDNVGGLTVGVGKDRVGVSNGEKDTKSLNVRKCSNLNHCINRLKKEITLSSQ